MMLSLSKAAAFLLLLFSLISVSFAQSSTDSTPSSTTSSSPQTHTVTVGKGTNAYDPNTIEASPGDLIVFEFFPSNHSVIKAAYGYPCVPFEDVVPNGATFFSGHFPLNEVLPNPPTWNLTVNDTQPVFFYCSAPGSCIDFQMVGVINPNASTPLATQKELAKSADYMIDYGQSFPQEAASSISSMAATATATATITSVASGPTNEGPPLTETSKHSGLSGGAIAGIVVGSIAVLLLAAALFFYVGRTKSLKQALAYKSNTEAARSSLPPPPPAKDMMYNPDHLAPYHPNTVSHHRNVPSYDAPPYSVLPKTPEPGAEELDSVVGTSPRLSPRSFGPGPRYTPGTEYGAFFAGSSDPIPVTPAPDASTRSNTMLSDATQSMARSQRNSHAGPHEMDAT